MNLFSKLGNTKPFILALILMGALGGCATIEGAGEDIEEAGDAIEDATDGE